MSDQSICWNSLLHFVRENSCEIEGVGVDPLPSERLGTRVGPSLGPGGRRDLVCQRRCGEDEEKGGKVAHGCK